MIELLKRLWIKLFRFIHRNDEEQYCSLPENIEFLRIQRLIDINKKRYSLIQDMTVEYLEENERIGKLLDELEAKYDILYNNED